jgi:hypothetical protein
MTYTLRTTLTTNALWVSYTISCGAYLYLVLVCVDVNQNELNLLGRRRLVSKIDYLLLLLLLLCRYHLSGIGWESNDALSAAIPKRGQV